MEVKSINPGAVGQRSRSQPTAVAQPRKAEAPADNRGIRGELRGPLAQRILKDSGIKPVEIHRYRVQLDIDDNTGRVVAEVRKKETGELVQEVPSRVLLRQAAMLKEALGMILDRPV